MIVKDESTLLQLGSHLSSFGRNLHDTKFGNTLKKSQADVEK